MRVALVVMLVMCSFSTPAVAAGSGSGDLRLLGSARLGDRITLTPYAVSAAVVPAYANVTTAGAWAQGNGGAALIGTNTITRLVADDIFPVGYAGMSVAQILFTAGNFNSVPVTCRLHLRFYAANGVGGGPGDYLWGFDGRGRIFDANTWYLFTLTNIPSGAFSMPASEFWAGITFDDLNGTTGATADQLSNMGQVTFGPATVGSTTDYAFLSTSAGSFDAGNPAGSTFNSVGCVCPPAPAPSPASFGWEFDVDLATPAARTSWGQLKALYR